MCLEGSVGLSILFMQALAFAYLQASSGIFYLRHSSSMKNNTARSSNVFNSRFTRTINSAFQAINLTSQYNNTPSQPVLLRKICGNMSGVEWGILITGH